MTNLLKPRFRATLIQLTASLMLISVGCKTVTYIPSDKAVIKVDPGTSFFATNSLYYAVPVARMIEIEEQLHRLKQLTTPK